MPAAGRLCFCGLVDKGVLVTEHGLCFRGLVRHLAAFGLMLPLNMADSGLSELSSLLDCLLFCI